MTYAPTTFGTLDDTLDYVASCSIDDTVTVTPNDDHTFTVSPDFYMLPEEISWTYERGVDYNGAAYMVSEDSRLFEPCEIWDSARHVAYSLPESAAALESGHAVTFAYGVAYDYESPCEDDCPADDCQCDRAAGWVAMARIHETGTMTL